MNEQQNLESSTAQELSHSLPRLDILIYGHDGRGLGHVSRSVGIGLALRRCYPELKVLLVTGCRLTQELIGRGPLDWLKLPAYETEVRDGVSRGARGKSMLEDKELGVYRGQQLMQLVRLYRPRLVLADHSPRGKHRELLPALAASGEETCWLLGVRGIIGQVGQLQDERVTDVFRRYFSGLLWYGDSEVLGEEHPGHLQAQYGVEPYQCGYVGRLGEYLQWTESVPDGNPPASVQRIVEKPSAPPVPPVEPVVVTTLISIPWIGEQTPPFLAALLEAIDLLDIREGTVLRNYHFFVEGGEGTVAARPNIRVSEPGGGYPAVLGRSDVAVIYGGYNSIVDILSLKKNALVVMREMRDQEQQLHLAALESKTDGLLRVVSETECRPEKLADLLDELAIQAILRTGHRQSGISAESPVRVDGAERAAHYLARQLGLRGA